MIPGCGYEIIVSLPRLRLVYHVNDEETALYTVWHPR